MTKPIPTTLMVAMLLLGCVGAALAANDAPPVTTPTHATADDAQRAQALLARAVAVYRKDPEHALVEFMLVGPYIDKELYIYVVGDDGIMRASGGSSLPLVGRDVRNLKDSDGKLFIAEMMANAKLKESGSVNYRWLDREHGVIERKVAYFQKVGNAFVAVGYYIHHSSPVEAKALLTNAVEAVKQDPKAAFTKFNDLNGGYIRDDLYVFVVGIDDHVMYASGTSPRLIGRKVDQLTDIDGKRIFPQSIAAAKARGNAEIQYTWVNPATGRHESKISYLERVGDYAVGVGYYLPQTSK
ncbi:cache domain-containing protein [Rhodoferax sp. 4810]|nr:cache domain-containing protein [Rhodoferax jenense]